MNKLLCKKLVDGLKQKIYEGKNGKKELKKCFKSKFSYLETKHGPDLFKTIRFKNARNNSISFDHFLNLIDY